MNGVDRRSVLKLLGATAGAGMFAGCLGSDDPDRPPSERVDGEYLVDPDAFGTRWLVPPVDEDYDFGFLNPRGVDDQLHQFGDVGMTVPIGIARFFRRWDNLDVEDVEQATLIDPARPPETTVPVIVIEGSFDREAFAQELRDYGEAVDREIVAESTVEGYDLLVAETDDAYGIGDDAMVLSIDPYAPTGDPDLVREVIETAEGGTETYPDHDDDIAELLDHLPRTHVTYAGKGDLLDVAPGGAVAHGESVVLSGGWVEFTLVSVFETAADAEAASPDAVDLLEGREDEFSPPGPEDEPDEDEDEDDELDEGPSFGGQFSQDGGLNLEVVMDSDSTVEGRVTIATAIVEASIPIDGGGGGPGGAP